MSGSTAPALWRKYPRKGVGRSLAAPHIEYFWHAHPREGDSHLDLEPEIGHFHVFFRAGADSPAIHIVGVSVSATGFPVALFCPNLWVTGDDSPPSAPDLFLAAQTAEWPSRGPLAPVSAWLQALFSLFSLEISALLTARDKAIAAISLENPALLQGGEWILASQPIDLPQMIQSSLSPEINQLS